MSKDSRKINFCRKADFTNCPDSCDLIVGIHFVRKYPDVFT